MKQPRSYKPSSVYLLRFLVIVLIATCLYAVNTFQQLQTSLDTTSASIADEKTVALQTVVGDASLRVPSYELFKENGLWSLVSKKRPLEKESRLPLIEIPVSHGDQQTSMKVAAIISDELQQLINAAEADGELLMVSSAYRTLEEQEAIYEDFVEENGTDLALQYVSPVGASEHHTGLSVDFSSMSNDCAFDSDTCSLSQSGAAWLAKNATRFGFIQRYPEGKQAVTGIAFEPWHFRFVGKPLASVMSHNDMTLDEVIEQIAPGYTRKTTN